MYSIRYLQKNIPSDIPKLYPCDNHIQLVATVVHHCSTSQATFEPFRSHGRRSPLEVRTSDAATMTWHGQPGAFLRHEKWFLSGHFLGKSSDNWEKTVFVDVTNQKPDNFYMASGHEAKLRHPAKDEHVLNSSLITGQRLEYKSTHARFFQQPGIQIVTSLR